MATAVGATTRNRSTGGSFELSMVDGRRTYDLLLELLDPVLVRFQFQISTISRGYDAADYFTKYPGRFISMHLQDTASKIGGVKVYFVELNSMDAIEASYRYLHDLQV